MTSYRTKQLTQNSKKLAGDSIMEMKVLSFHAQSWLMCSSKNCRANFISHLHPLPCFLRYLMDVHSVWCADAAALMSVEPVGEERRGHVPGNTLETKAKRGCVLSCHVTLT